MPAFQELGQATVGVECWTLNDVASRIQRDRNPGRLGDGRLKLLATILVLKGRVRVPHLWRFTEHPWVILFELRRRDSIIRRTPAMRLSLVPQPAIFRPHGNAIDGTDLHMSLLCVITSTAISPENLYPPKRDF